MLNRSSTPGRVFLPIVLNSRTSQYLRTCVIVIIIQDSSVKLDTASELYAFSLFLCCSLPFLDDVMLYLIHTMSEKYSFRPKILIDLSR